MNYIKRCFKSPNNSYFLFGPRGTGKTTWLNQNCGDALAVNLLEPELYRRYHARPERLRELVEGNPHKNTVIIDEIQKVPELLDVVHFLIEEMPRLQFILTGSSARKIKQKGVNLLAGRAVVRSLHPFTASELKNHFQLKKALETGLIPLITASQNPSDSLNAYIQLYLEEEVKMEGLVRNIGNFARFLEAVSFSHAQVLNVSNVARECEVERKTVQGFLEILYDLLMAYLVPVFTKKAKRAVIQHPKFFLFDTGVYRALRPSGPLDRPGEIEGPALEGLAAQHIRAWIDYSESQAKLYYWRTRGGSEVDFIIYGKEEFLAIEVKNTRNIRKNDLRSLRSFHNDYPECRPLLIYRGSETLRIDHILCIPCEAFLKSIKPNKPLLSFSK